MRLARGELYAAKRGVGKLEMALKMTEPLPIGVEVVARGYDGLGITRTTRTHGILSLNYCAGYN